MKRRSWSALALFVTVLAAQAPAAGPRFDAVSIKPAAPGLIPEGMANACITLPIGCRKGGEWRATAVRLDALIEAAYRINRAQLEGLPAALDRSGYDITATVAPDVSEAGFLTMLRGMLADRFHLVVRQESRDLDSYVLGLAPGGFRLPPSQGPCPADAPPDCSKVGIIPAGAGDYELKCRNASIAQLISLLARYAGGQPLVDQTALTGRYDFDLRFTAPGAIDNTRDAAEAAIDLFLNRLAAALQNQAGLELNLTKPTKHAVPVLTVESVSAPTPD